MDITHSSLYDLGASVQTGIECVKTDNVVFYQDGKSVFRLDKKDSFYSGEKFFSFFISAFIPIFPRVMAGVSLEYSDYRKDTSDSINFNIECYNKFGTIELGNTAGIGQLNDLGVKMYQIGDEDFIKLCGAQYKVSHDLGSKLNISLRMLYSSNYDKKELEIALHGVIDIWIVIGRIKLALRAEKSKKNIDFELEIAAYQEGGDVFSLAKIFGQGDNAKNLLTCRMEDIEPCEKVLFNLIQYAKDDYPRQLLTLDDAIILETRYSKYDIPLEVIDENLDEYRGKIAEIYTNLRLQKDFITNHLLANSYHYKGDGNNYKELLINLSTYPSKIATVGANVEVVSYWKWEVDMLLTPTRINLEAIIKKIDEKIDDAKEIAKKCYKYTADQCKKVADEIMLPDIGEVDGYKRAILMLANCDNKVYAKYLFPIGENRNQNYIYQENTKYVEEDLGEQYLLTRYAFEDNALYTVNSRLLSEIHFCGYIQTDESGFMDYGFATIQNPKCVELICPFPSHSLDVLTQEINTKL